MPSMLASAVSFSILAMQAHSRWDQTPQVLDVVWLAHKGHAEVFHAERHHPGNFFTVEIGDGRGADIGPGQVHPLVGLEEPAIAHPAFDPVAAHRRDVDGQEPVIEEDPRSRHHIPGELGIGGRNVAFLSGSLGDEVDDLTRREGDRFGQFADPDSRTVQVDQDRGRGPPLLAHLLDSTDPASPGSPGSHERH